MVQQWGLFTEQEGLGSQEFVDTENVNEAETSTASSTEEEAEPPQPGSSGSKHKATKRKADRPRTKEKRRKEREGWREFIDVYREECAKDRKSWEMMVQSMNDTFTRAINVLVSSVNPAVGLKMSPNPPSNRNTE
uniref:Uncharacterized protein n=2 Tax=Ciona intestinalis TaxID=7719 RepID=F6WU72_CIOIN